MDLFTKFAFEAFNLKKADAPVAGLPDQLGPDFTYDGHAFAASRRTWAHDLETVASSPDCDIYRSVIRRRISGCNCS